MTHSPEKLALTPAEENPWYLLATLYKNTPGLTNKERQEKNREAWNRYYASQLTDTERKNLNRKSGNIESFNDDGMSNISNLFAERSASHNREMPSQSDRPMMNRLYFEECVDFSDYILINVEFNNSTFSAGANFNNSTFYAGGDFIQSRFSADTEFRNARFQDADFRNANFCGYAKFSDTNFSARTDFSEATFSKDADFSSSTFSGDAIFRSTIFSKNAFFSSAMFSKRAIFIKTKFFQRPDSTETIFDQMGDFIRSIFRKMDDPRKEDKSELGFLAEGVGGDPNHDLLFEGVNFSSATFCGYTEFNDAVFRCTVILTDTKLTAPTDFDGCQFEKFPPQLDGATLHQRTNWRRVAWPSLNGLTVRQVEDLTDDYCVLKLEMDKQKRHEDELMFFSKELECRQFELGKIKGLHILLYGWTCNYGQSITLPLCWLIDLVLIGWNVIMSAYMPEITWDRALLISIANCLGSFGVHKELVESLLKCASAGMQMLLMFQGITALILLFLIGLGLRNRFRMK